MKKNKIKKTFKNPKTPLKIQKKNYKKIKNIIRVIYFFVITCLLLEWLSLPQDEGRSIPMKSRLY